MTLIDSKILFNVIISNGPTTGKKIMFYIKASREAYNERIVDNIIRIRRTYNLADAMTKLGIPTEFLDAIRNGKIHYEMERSITRTKMTSNKEKENAECENNDE